jgi:hypothetical protein
MCLTHRVWLAYTRSMDPVSLVVAAVIAGASAALKDTASDAVKGAYRELRVLLRRRFEGNQAAQGALEKVERDPDNWRELLEEQLRHAAVADEELVRAARSLLARADPEGAQTGKYNVTITGSRGIIVGDGTHVSMTFGSD